jgi:hypothetical protein
MWKKKLTFIGTTFRCPIDYEFTIAGKIFKYCSNTESNK